MDSKLTSFVTALSEAASSEISSVTDPTYGPDSSGVGQSEISSLTDPTYGSDSRGTPGAGRGGGESAGTLSSPYAVDAPTSVTDHASSWNFTLRTPSHLKPVDGRHTTGASNGVNDVGGSDVGNAGGSGGAGGSGNGGVGGGVGSASNGDGDGGGGGAGTVSEPGTSSGTLSSPDAEDAPTWVTGHDNSTSSSWTWAFHTNSKSGSGIGGDGDGGGGSGGVGGENVGVAGTGAGASAGAGARAGDAADSSAGAGAGSKSGTSSGALSSAYADDAPILGTDHEEGSSSTSWTLGFDSNFEPIRQPKAGVVRAVKFGEFSNSGFDSSAGAGAGAGDAADSSAGAGSESGTSSGAPNSAYADDAPTSGTDHDEGSSSRSWTLGFDSNFEPIPQPKVADVREVKFGEFSNSGFDFTG